MISTRDLEKLIMRKSSASQPSTEDVKPSFELDDDGEEYQGVGLGGIMAASEKLLAINRGLIDTDERDSMKFQKIMTRPALFRERIKMDSGKLARTAMYRAAKTKSLKGINPGLFNGYIDSILVGNPLTAPLEEINPMQLVENSRRITRMGPGGLGSDDSITEESQAVHPSQFGFISPLEGPESGRAGIDVRMAWGSKLGSNGRIYQKMFDRRSNRYRWMSPEDLDGLTVKLPD
jgi:DNA-directed RNA polymerase beta subunit